MNSQAVHVSACSVRWHSSQPAKIGTRRQCLEVLGLPENATPGDVKASYYNLSLRLHPDRNDGSEEANMRFQAVLQAYERLRELEMSPPDPNSSAIEGKVPYWATSHEQYDGIMNHTRAKLDEFVRENRKNRSLGAETPAEDLEEARLLTGSLVNVLVLGVVVYAALHFLVLGEEISPTPKALQSETTGRY